MSSTFNADSLPPRLRDMVELLRDQRARPDRIEDLWRSNESPVAHMQSENIDWWATDEEVAEVLNDDERLRRMVAEFQFRCLSLGIFGQSQNRFLASTNGIFVNPGCAGCNTPYDAGGCRHANSPHRSPMMDPEVNELVHTALLMLSAMNYLLVQDHLKSTNRLAA